MTPPSASAAPHEQDGTYQQDGLDETSSRAALAQHQHAEPETVELATLTLPRCATDAGLEIGDGDRFVLEARDETVEKLQTDAQKKRSHISAVIDLDKLGELVGVPGGEFINGLHQDIQDNRTAAAAAAVAAAAEEGAGEDEEVGLAAGEDTPLIPTTGGADQVDREEDATATDKISLPADPFLETLADVLLPAPTDEVPPPSFPPDDDDTAWDEEDAVTEAVATTTMAGDDEQQHYARDAFLLDVPHSDDEGNLEHHYVLALPEIQMEGGSEVTAASVVSGKFWGEGGEGHPLLDRAMSILPTTTRLPPDVESVRIEATEHAPTKADPTEVHIDIVVERRVPVIGYVILLSGLLALSSVGAALDLQQGGVTPAMKTLWRQIATCAALSPFVIKSLILDGFPRLSFTRMVILLPTASIAYGYMCLAFVIALDMTTMANAFVLSNMTSLVIIAGRAVMGLPILHMEGVGAITGFLGAAICAEDASRTILSGGGGGGGEHHQYPMLGNLLALSASFGTAFYLIVAKDLRKDMDLFVFMFAIMGLASVFVSFFLMGTGQEVSFDMDPIHGVFGWLNLAPDRLPLELYMAVVCNCLGTTGYIAVMKYFEPIVPATVMLLEPVLGALLGTAAGTAPLPGSQTWLGDLVVALGTFLVIRAGSRKTESIDATEALRHPPPRPMVEKGGVVSTPVMVTKSPLIATKNPHTSNMVRKNSMLSEKSDHTKVIWEV